MRVTAKFEVGVKISGLQPACVCGVSHRCSHFPPCTCTSHGHDTHLPDEMSTPSASMPSTLATASTVPTPQNGSTTWGQQRRHGRRERVGGRGLRPGIAGEGRLVGSTWRWLIEARPRRSLHCHISYAAAGTRAWRAAVERHLGSAADVPLKSGIQHRAVLGSPMPLGKPWSVHLGGAADVPQKGGAQQRAVQPDALGPQHRAAVEDVGRAPR